MRILSLSGDTGSTYVIAKALQTEWQKAGHEVVLFAPVKRFSLRVLVHALRRRPDVIHAHLGGATILARRLGNWLNSPVLASLHGFQKPKHCVGLTHFTAVSDTIREHYAKGGLPLEAITVIANGHDATLADAPKRTTRDTLNLPEGSTLLGMMATFTPMKQHDLLLKGFALALKEHPQLHLLLAGEGPLKSEALALVKQLNLQDHVHFVGFLDDQASFYHALDLYIQSSRDEGFCMPLAEAMAAGIPVISTKNKAPEEYLRDHENALMVAEMTPESITETLRYALKHPDALVALTHAAKQTVAPWQWPQIAAQYEAKLKEAIACHPH
jgi:glycosyltransferase involved in cell wall biosynthesis